MGKACSTYEREIYITLWTEDVKVNDSFDDLRINGRVILE